MDHSTSARPNTEGQTLRDMVTELLADNMGREALMRVVLDELAARTVRVRRLEVVDPLGRLRIQADASETAGELVIFGFSDYDHRGDRNNWAYIGANEEVDGSMVYMGICSGGESVTQFDATEGDDGTPGRAVIDIDAYEATGEYGPHGDIRTRRSRHTRVTADGAETKVVDR